MSLEETINQDIKQAMLAKDKPLLESLRAIKSALLLLKTDKGATGEISESVATATLQKLVKQRRETAAIYSEQGRQDLADQELFQADVIERYLPKQLPIEEVEALVKTIVTELGASSIKDMGRVMGATSKQLAGRADNKTVSEIVKRLLASC